MLSRDDIGASPLGEAFLLFALEVFQQLLVVVVEVGVSFIAFEKISVLGLRHDAEIIVDVFFQAF